MPAMHIGKTLKHMGGGISSRIEIEETIQYNNLVNSISTVLLQQSSRINSNSVVNVTRILFKEKFIMSFQIIQLLFCMSNILERTSSNILEK